MFTDIQKTATSLARRFSSDELGELTDALIEMRELVEAVELRLSGKTNVTPQPNSDYFDEDLRVKKPATTRARRAPKDEKDEKDEPPPDPESEDVAADFDIPDF